jgi:hypothetical protein
MHDLVPSILSPLSLERNIFFCWFEQKKFHCRSFRLCVRGSRVQGLHSQGEVQRSYGATTESLDQFLELGSIFKRKGFQNFLPPSRTRQLAAFGGISLHLDMFTTSPPFIFPFTFFLKFYFRNFPFEPNFSLSLALLPHRAACNEKRSIRKSIAIQSRSWYKCQLR